MDHLQGAFDELSDVHTRVLVMRELEGMSYREIGQKLDLTRPAVESALFRARRRLETEYEELSEGRRCEAMAGTIARIAAGVQRGRRSSALRATRAAATAAAATPASLGSSRCPRWAPCARRLRRCCRCPGSCVALAGMAAGSLDSSDRVPVRPLSERAAALVAVAALAGAGGAALGTGALRGDREAAGDGRVAAERSVAGTGEQKRGATGAATGGERRGARQASGRRASGPAGGRAGDTTERGGARTESGSQEGTPTAPSGPAVDGPASKLPSARPSRGPTPPRGRPAVELDLPLPEAPRVTVPVPADAAVELPECPTSRRAAAGHRSGHGRAPRPSLSAMPLPARG